jgi:hypothetical protein
MPALFGFRWGMMDEDSRQDLTYYDFVLSICLYSYKNRESGGEMEDGDVALRGA